MYLGVNVTANMYLTLFTLWRLWFLPVLFVFKTMNGSTDQVKFGSDLDKYGHSYIPCFSARLVLNYQSYYPWFDRNFVFCHIYNLDHSLKCLPLFPTLGLWSVPSAEQRHHVPQISSLSSSFIKNISIPFSSYMISLFFCYILHS